ncbi:uncharacterized protein BX664DRAFT_359636 [Halteromyces radiatus]|uniref:uncharacterized protein n=1 Tax=Halteromyces radiatus TaxID=101107 RepID=UPI0022202A8C|nr:uncharacterized protein BX664DRAFT_359636 [Halteromyces radiatus]KAI8086077.1 hypothetical protein BX664DRAFT_359636 [Halteromyces radiatus]
MNNVFGTRSQPIQLPSDDEDEGYTGLVSSGLKGCVPCLPRFHLGGIQLPSEIEDATLNDYLDPNTTTTIEPLLEEYNNQERQKAFGGAVLQDSQRFLTRNPFASSSFNSKNQDLKTNNNDDTNEQQLNSFTSAAPRLDFFLDNDEDDAEFLSDHRISAVISDTSKLASQFEVFDTEFNVKHQPTDTSESDKNIHHDNATVDQVEPFEIQSDWNEPSDTHSAANDDMEQIQDDEAKGSMVVADENDSIHDNNNDTVSNNTTDNNDDNYTTLPNELETVPISSRKELAGSNNSGDDNVPEELEAIHESLTDDISDNNNNNDITLLSQELESLSISSHKELADDSNNDNASQSRELETLSISSNKQLVDDFMDRPTSPAHSIDLTIRHSQNMDIDDMTNSLDVIEVQPVQKESDIKSTILTPSSVPASSSSSSPMPSTSTSCTTNTSKEFPATSLLHTTIPLPPSSITPAQPHEENTNNSNTVITPSRITSDSSVSPTESAVMTTNGRRRSSVAAVAHSLLGDKLDDFTEKLAYIRKNIIMSLDDDDNNEEEDVLPSKQSQQPLRRTRSGSIQQEAQRQSFDPFTSRFSGRSSQQQQLSTETSQDRQARHRRSNSLMDVAPSFTKLVQQIGGNQTTEGEERHFSPSSFFASLAGPEVSTSSAAPPKPPRGMQTHPQRSSSMPAQQRISSSSLPPQQQQNRAHLLHGVDEEEYEDDDLFDFSKVIAMGKNVRSMSEDLMGNGIRLFNDFSTRMKNRSDASIRNTQQQHQQQQQQQHQQQEQQEQQQQPMDQEFLLGDTFI